MMIPSNVAAEAAVLGCILSDNRLMDQVPALTVEDFYDKTNSLIYKSMTQLHQAAKPLDPITLAENINRGSQSAVVSVSDLQGMMTRATNTAHFSGYVDAVKSTSVQRQMIDTCNEIIKQCCDGDDPAAITSKMEQMLYETGQSHCGTDATPVSDILDHTMKRIIAATHAKGNVIGIPTGLKDLDDLTTGMYGGDYILIGARPSMGKTALALTILQNAAIRRQIPTVLFSVEMSESQIATRLLSMESRVDGQRIRRGTLTESEWNDLQEARKTIESSPIIIDDKTSRIEDLRAKARKYQRRDGIQLIIIDYLSLLHTARRIDNRVQEVSEISLQIKLLAKELDVPVIVLSQLNRLVEGRADKRPVMSDIRESGSVEQDADVIAFLHRESYYNDGAPASEAELHIAKQRNGPVGTIPLLWRPQYGRFDNVYMGVVS